MFRIEDDVAVTEKLNEINECIDRLKKMVDGVDSNISQGWGSERSKGAIEPIIENVKGSISEMVESVNNVQTNVNDYIKNVKSADAAGSLESNGKAG